MGHIGIEICVQLFHEENKASLVKVAKKVGIEFLESQNR